MGQYCGEVKPPLIHSKSNVLYVEFHSDNENVDRGFTATFLHIGMYDIQLLSCQPRVKVTLCFVYKVIRDLKSIDHLCIDPIRRIGLIHL